MKTRRALVIVDVQKDFCEGGNLAVEGGNLVAHRIGWYAKAHILAYDKIVFTRDFHDPYGDNDGHFSETPDFNVSWPRHCEIGTDGVKLHPAMRGIQGRLFSKGFGKNDYSGFQGRACNEFLDTYLRKNGIRNLDIMGIAGDYCVRATALDGVKKGYRVSLSSWYIASVGGNLATHKMIDEVYDLQR